jgi:hypothetical protein
MERDREISTDFISSEFSLRLLKNGDDHYSDGLLSEKGIETDSWKLVE